MNLIIGNNVFIKKIRKGNKAGKQHVAENQSLSLNNLLLRAISSIFPAFATDTYWDNN